MNASSFPALYHAHHSLHGEDLPFWLSLAQRQGDPILELGCGTGRVLVPLLQAGHAAIGLDNDAHMLAFLRKNLPAGLPAAQVIQADMTCFRLERFFALILLPCNTFSTLPASACQAMLRCVRAHMRPGGLFAFSLPNPELLRQLPRRSAAELEETLTHPEDGEPVQVSSAWQRGGETFLLTWHYDHLLPDGRIERNSTQARHILRSAQVIGQALAAAGLETRELYGDFEGAAYEEESPHLIVVSRAFL
jgi:SAM-dependent methyltransferase